MKNKGQCRMDDLVTVTTTGHAAYVWSQSPDTVSEVEFVLISHESDDGFLNNWSMVEATGLL